MKKPEKGFFLRTFFAIGSPLLRISLKKEGGDAESRRPPRKQEEQSHSYADGERDSLHHRSAEKFRERF